MFIFGNVDLLKSNNLVKFLIIKEAHSFVFRKFTQMDFLEVLVRLNSLLLFLGNL